MLKIVLLCFALLHVCDSYKLLLVFPFPSKSHAILGEGYVKHLLAAGHDLTYITAVPMKTSHPRLRQIDVSSNFNLILAEFLSMDQNLDYKFGDYPTIMAIIMLPYIADISNGTVRHESVQKLLKDPNENFDAVVVEWMFNEIYSGFASVFNCPLIWSSSLEFHTNILSLIDESLNPAYTADVLFSNDPLPPFSFWKRTSKLFSHVTIGIVKWWVEWGNSDIFVEAFSTAVTMRGRKLPTYDEARYNGSLVLGNSHVSIGQAVRLPQNYGAICGYHIDEVVKPLPADLQSIMDNAKNGVIYFSMGSMLKGNSLPQKIKEGLVNVFGSLKQTVLWKFEEKLPNLPENVHIVQWAPQPAILAHPNCILFVTHGGLLSTTEAIHYGVPIIGIPVFSDQFTNVFQAEIRGFAEKVDFNYDLPSDLKDAMQKILGNPRYRQRVKELSSIYHDRVVPPGKELVYRVEHVVRTRGAPHLRSPALMVPWYQKMYIDLLAVILIAVYFLRIALKYLYTKTFAKKKELSNKKKN